MRRLLVSFVFYAAFLIAAPVALGSPGSGYLRVATAKLYQAKFVASQQHRHPGAKYERGTCRRITRSHVDCFVVERRTVDGIRERGTYTVHVSREVKGRTTWTYVRPKYDGPIED